MYCRKSFGLLLLTLVTYSAFIAACSEAGDSDHKESSESYVPRVRLVKDGAHDFHFQWDEPLKEERIILCRSESFFQVVTADNVIEGYKPTGFPEQRLVYFPEGAFTSKLFTDTLVFIEILSAHERGTFPLPAYARDATADFPENLRVPLGHNLSFISHPSIPGRSDAYRRILREHPFKPYRVDKPSRITFEKP